MADAVLDSDLQTLWDGSTVQDFRAGLLRTQAVRDQTAAINSQVGAVTAGVQGLMDTAGAAKDDLIERLFVNMAVNYMKPATTTQTQPPESMDAEAAADAMRLRKAVWATMDAIKFIKENWS